MTDYKVLWQQMCERCDELDKKLAQQETLPWTNKMCIDVPNQILYTAPQRKPLTENEIKHLWYEACQTNLELTSQLIVHLARNIEAAHGIKGEA